MMIYILFFCISISNGQVECTTTEYASATHCQAASTALLADKIENKMYGIILNKCVAKAGVIQ